MARPIDRFTHYRALISLGVPIIIGQVGTIVLGFTDTLMVGHHSTVELAAAGFINSMFSLVMIFALGFSYSLTPIVGSMYGRGATGDIGKALVSGLAANTELAVILLCVTAAFYLNLHNFGQPEELLALMRPYLLVHIVSLPFLCWLNTFNQFYNTLGDSKVTMYVLLGGNLLNIVLNYVLIYGVFFFPELGLFGAGVATLTSRVAMCLTFVVIFVFGGKYGVYRCGLSVRSLSVSLLRRYNSLGWPIAFQIGMEVAAFSLTAIFVGWMGVVSLAAHQIMLTVSQFFYMVYYGMAAAVSVRVSYFYGQGDYSSIRSTVKAGLRIILFTAVVVSTPMFLLRGVVGTWFTDSEEVCVLVSQTIIPLILYQFGDGLQCTYANALRGLSHVRVMLYSAFVSYVVISLPLSWFLGVHMKFGLVGLWSAFPVCLTCAGVFYYVSYKKFVKLRESGGGTA